MKFLRPKLKNYRKHLAYIQDIVRGKNQMWHLNFGHSVDETSFKFVRHVTHWRLLKAYKSIETMKSDSIREGIDTSVFVTSRFLMLHFFKIFYYILRPRPRKKLF